mmetsp:Transcript_11766/g.28547  ORF Transcript_11766/g.28547 Transcript_11766/m.28547 type:complete len:217 (-) Transcript_11766:5370-6020(-)
MFAAAGAPPFAAFVGEMGFMRMGEIEFILRRLPIICKGLGLPRTLGRPRGAGDFSSDMKSARRGECVRRACGITSSAFINGLRLAIGVRTALRLFPFRPSTKGDTSLVLVFPRGLRALTKSSSDCRFGEPPPPALRRMGGGFGRAARCCDDDDASSCDCEDCCSGLFFGLLRLCSPPFALDRLMLLLPDMGTGTWWNAVSAFRFPSPKISSAPPGP